MRIAKGASDYQNVFHRLYPEIYSETGELLVKNITFVVTNQCNLRCTYCYQGHKNDGKMNWDTAKASVDMLIRAFKENHPYINRSNAYAVILEFIGGEPLLAIDLIHSVTEYFKHRCAEEGLPWAYNYMISITTNGILYDSPKVKDYIKRNSGKVSFTITIDGDKELHDACRLFPDGSGSYQTVEKAVKKQMAEFGNVSTKLTISPDNVAYLDKALRNLVSLGLHDIHANYVYEEGWTIEHARTLYEQMKSYTDYAIETKAYEKCRVSLFDSFIGNPLDKDNNQNWCGGTGKMMAIATDGKIYPCLRYLPTSVGDKVKPMVIGDIAIGIGGTAEQLNTIESIKAITRRSQSSDECFNCPIASGCGWCSAYNYERFGTPNQRATFICNMHKARVLGTSYYLNSVYRALRMDDRYALHIPEAWALQIIGEDELNKLKQLSEI